MNKKMDSKLVLSTLFLFALLAIKSVFAADYAVTVSRDDSDIYSIQGIDIYVVTNYCYEYAFYDDAILSMSGTTGSLYFIDSQTTCSVTGVYAPVETLNTGNYSVTTSRLAKDWYEMFGYTDLIRTQYCYQYAYYDSSVLAIASLNGTGTLYFSNGSNCGVTDIYYLMEFVDQPSNYDIIVEKSGTGSGTIASSPIGIDCGNDCSQSYASGTSVSLTAAANTGSVFSGWSGACTGNSTTCDLAVDGHKSVTATFTLVIQQSLLLQVTKSGNGQGSVSSVPSGIDCGSDCDELYASGTSVTLTATADTGSVFSEWTGSCSGSNPTCTVTMSAGQNVDAVFDVISSSGCAANTTNPVISGSVVYTGKEACVATNSITTEPTVLVAVGADVAYKAPKITLGPNFSIQSGAQFKAGANIDVTGYVLSTKSVVVNQQTTTTNASRVETPTTQITGPVKLTFAQLSSRLRTQLDALGATAQDIYMDVTGSYVVFTTNAALTINDINTLEDVYIYDINSDVLDILSINLEGYSANGASRRPRIDGGGNYVVYSSEASDLVAVDVNSMTDIFLHEIATGATWRVSWDEEGSESTRPATHPAIASSRTLILYDRVDREGYYRIYVYDYEWPAFGTVNISTALLGNSLQADHQYPAISPDGRYIAFLKTDQDDDLMCRAVRYDQELGDMEQLDCPGDYNQDNRYVPVFAADGQTVVWESLQ